MGKSTIRDLVEVRNPRANQIGQLLGKTVTIMRNVVI
jgi:hypothetical protein